MVFWRIHMDDQAEEDLHHEDVSSVDSVDSTPTGSVESGRSTASEARQPLFSAASWRGLVGRVVRHLCIQAIGQCQLDVTGSNRSAAAVNAWRRRQCSLSQNDLGLPGAHMGATAGNGTGSSVPIHGAGAVEHKRTQHSADGLHARSFHVICDSLRAPCSIAGSRMNLDYEIGRTKHCSMPWKRPWQGCPRDDTSTPHCVCSRNWAETSGGDLWRRPGGHWKASQAHELSDGWCTVSSDMPVGRCDIFHEFFHVVWHQHVRTCPLPPEFWSSHGLLERSEPRVTALHVHTVSCPLSRS